MHRKGRRLPIALQSYVFFLIYMQKNLDYMRFLLQSSDELRARLPLTRRSKF